MEGLNWETTKKANAGTFSFIYLFIYLGFSFMAVVNNPVIMRRAAVNWWRRSCQGRVLLISRQGIKSIRQKKKKKKKQKEGGSSPPQDGNLQSFWDAAFFLSLLPTTWAAMSKNTASYIKIKKRKKKNTHTHTTSCNKCPDGRNN